MDASRYGRTPRGAGRLSRQLLPAFRVTVQTLTYQRNPFAAGDQLNNCTVLTQQKNWCYNFHIILISEITSGKAKIMNIPESCARCLYDKQRLKADDPGFLMEVKSVIDSRSENDTSPVLVYRFNQIYERRFGKKPRQYEDEKRRYNDLALSMEPAIRKKIEEASDPVAAAFMYSRIGNYIDFGALSDVSEETFLALMGEPEMQDRDEKTYKSFLAECGKAKSFLLLADNCGEIVFDKLLLEQLHNRFPLLHFTVMVRGGEVLNDAVSEDAAYVGIDELADIVSNGKPVAGTVYEMLPQDARDVLDNADVIFSKGQGNYESLSASGRHVFYSFLCKCELFTNRFHVPKLTGMFVESGEDAE